MTPLDELEAREEAGLFLDALTRYVERGQEEAENALLLVVRYTTDIGLIELGSRFKRLRRAGLVTNRSALHVSIRDYITAAIAAITEDLSN